MAGYRKQKLEGEILRIIGDSLLKEIKDPRIGFATVTRVTINRDYTIADVGISVIGDEKEKRKSIAGLESAAGFIQHIVGKALKMRNTPRIRFHLDTSIEEGIRMVDVLNKLEEEESGEPDDNS